MLGQEIEWKLREFSSLLLSVIREIFFQIAMKDKKWKTKQIRKDVPIWMQSSKE